MEFTLYQVKLNYIIFKKAMPPEGGKNGSNLSARP